MQSGDPRHAVAWAQASPLDGCRKLQDEITVSTEGDQFVLSWNECPRCAHPGSHVQPRSGWIASLDDSGEDDGEIELLVVHCNCGIDHADRPAGDPHVGCGLNCQLEVRLQ
jgi:hypothetical protein